jgi:membrane-associated phospholipid phosphatase
MAFILLPSLHDWFLQHVKSGVPAVIKLQKIRTHSLDRLSLTCSALGSDFAYLAILPFLYWNVDMTITRKVIVLWSFGFYACNHLKDLLLLPRPFEVNDGVLNIEKIFDRRNTTTQQNTPHRKIECMARQQMYGLPSIHAFSASCVPFYVLLLSQKEFSYSFPLLTMVAVAWCIGTGFSRIYLGLHTLADVLSGLILGAIAVGAGALGGDYIEEIILEPYSWVPVVQPVCVLMLLMAYPTPFRYTVAFLNTARVAGFGSGVVLGTSWMFHALITPSDSFEVCVSADCVWMVVLRTVFGFGCLLLTHRFANKFFRTVLPPLGCFAPRLSYNNACIIKQDCSFHHLPEKLRRDPLICGANDKKAPSSKDGEARSNGSSGSNGSKGKGADGTAKDYMTEIPINYCTAICVGFTAAFTVPLALKVSGLL